MCGLSQRVFVLAATHTYMLSKARKFCGALFRRDCFLRGPFFRRNCCMRRLFVSLLLILIVKKGSEISPFHLSDRQYSCHFCMCHFADLIWNRWRKAYSLRLCFCVFCGVCAAVYIYVCVVCLVHIQLCVSCVVRRVCRVCRVLCVQSASCV